MGGDWPKQRRSTSSIIYQTKRNTLTYLECHCSSIESTARVTAAYCARPYPAKRARTICRLELADRKEEAQTMGRTKQIPTNELGGREGPRNHL